jgi:hypothetical protein
MTLNEVQVCAFLLGAVTEVDSHLGNSVRPRIPEPRNYGSHEFYDFTLVPISRDVTVNNVEFCDLTIPEIAFGRRNQVSSFKA